MTAIDQKRLEEISRRTLDSGAHGSPDDGLCVMEAVAYVAGEPHSGHPVCACPVISAFLRRWNDDLADEDRQRLLAPLIPRLVGSRSSEAVQLRRSWMAFDWLVRTHTPAWLRAAGLVDNAIALEVHAEIVGGGGVASCLPAILAAWDAARDAAWSTAWDAARSAAGVAARDGAWAAARDGAWAAAGSAARVGAWAAARAAPAPTVAALQQSALALVDRMLEVKE